MAYETDKEWVIGLKNGNNTAYSKLIAECKRDAVYHGVLGSSDQDDVAQKVAMIFFEDSHKLDPTRSVKALRRTIVRNLLIDELRRRAYRTFTDVSKPDGDPADQIIDRRARTPLEILITKEQLETVTDPRTYTCPTQAKVIEAKHLVSGKKSAYQTALRLDIPEGTVKSAENAARHRLKELRNKCLSDE
jgi:RNA polymerase sigma factor (sigma-70 family)